MPIDIDSFDLLGVHIHALTTASTIKAVEEAIQGGTRGYVVFCTVSSVLTAHDDDSVCRAIAAATLVTPDGMPLVWLGRRAGHRVERVYGPDFMLDLFAGTGSKYRHFFYGAAPGVADQMVARLTHRFPRLLVAGTYSPPIDLSPLEADLDEVRVLNDANADIVWVGLGHPKQELWMHSYRPHLNAPMLAGVGAAFDFHAGRKREGPEWMKRSGLQWLHRLASEPTRLWRRYLIGNTRFMYLLAAEALKKKVRR